MQNHQSAFRQCTHGVSIPIQITKFDCQMTVYTKFLTPRNEPPVKCDCDITWRQSLLIMVGGLALVALGIALVGGMGAYR